MWPAALVEGTDSGAEALTPFFGRSMNSDERLLTAYMSLLAAGKMSALDIPKIKP
jgi:hypothetical protein